MPTWIKAECSVRITKASFDFGTNVWSVEGYLDFKGPKGMEMVVPGGKLFKHSWYCDKDEFNLRELVEQKVGMDLFAAEEVVQILKS